MPRPQIFSTDDFTPEELAAMPVIQGEPLTAEDIARDEEIVSLAREIVTLVNAGKLMLDQSKVIGDTLFVRTNVEYYVLAPDGGIQQSDSADIDADRWPYQGLIDNLDVLRDTLKSWRDEALASN